MKLPKMRQPAQSRSTQEVFGGYDHNLNIGEGTFYEMENMTSDYFPVLSPRAPRNKTGFGTAQALVSSHGLCRVENGKFYLPDGTDAGVTLKAGEKQLVAMGAYVIILPDKVWVNVAGEGERSGSIEQHYYSTADRVVLRPCKADGTAYTSISETKPEIPEEGQMWLDVTGIYPVLKQWEEATGMWLSMETGYVRVEIDTIGDYFERGDSISVEIDGIPYALKNALRHLGEVTELTGLEDEGSWGTLKGNWVIQEKERDFIVISGYMGVPLCRGGVNAGDDTCDGEVIIQRKLPDMDLVVESGNRLWGCKYGTTENGFVNEIYASKLGDFKNWESYQGISTDSYTVSVGVDGPFTGAVSYQGSPVFFKEHCMIEISGNQPSSYQLRCTPCDGVGKDCEKSLAIVNNVLYYKSNLGVCAFDGSLPVQIGQALGALRYDRAVAGAGGRKYYICMQEGKEHSLFVYDTARGLWHREDSLPVQDFCTCGGILYANTASGIYKMNVTNGYEPSLHWLVETGKLGMRMPESKYVTRMTLRLSMAMGSELSVYACYDSGDTWEHLYSVNSGSLRSISVPLRPRRCDHLRLRLEGVGDVKLYSITKTIEKGSEL